MSRWVIAVAVLVVSGCATTRDFSAMFDEWEHRLDARPKTGFAWTREDMALDRALGTQAHRHEAFLAAKLKANPYVVTILDAQARAASKPRSTYVVIPTRMTGTQTAV